MSPQDEAVTGAGSQEGRQPVDPPGVGVDPGVEHALIQGRLWRLMLLSLAAGLTTMALKGVAAAVTGSVGLLSDALESGVNVVAAAVGLVALRTAAKPPDDEHQFGHGKAEYLSAGVEGGMVLTAAVLIVWTSIRRLMHLEPIEQPGVGLVLSTIAAVINLVVGLILVRVGSRHRSITVEADGRHLLTDVWTSAGVLAAVAINAVFDVPIIDPIVALFVGVNILFVGYGLLRRSVFGLLDGALPPEDSERIMDILRRHCDEDRVEFGRIRTRESGRQRFIHLTMFVPGDWSVTRSHDLADLVESEISQELAGAKTFTHVEPIGEASGASVCRVPSAEDR